MSHCKKSGQKHGIKIANSSFEGVAKFKYLATTLTDQNFMHEEIKSRLNSGNVCNQSAQSILSSCLLSRNVKVKIYKTITLPAFMGVKLSLSRTKGKHRLRVFENRVLKRIFGPKRDEVTGERRKLHNEETHILYSSPNIIRQMKSRRMRWSEHVARMGEDRKVYRVLVGNPEGKRPLGRPRRRWEDGIRMDIREIGWGCRVGPVG
jgi:hypothetical protein